jgi:hypothetical protein
MRILVQFGGGFRLGVHGAVIAVDAEAHRCSICHPSPCPGKEPAMFCRIAPLAVVLVFVACDQKAESIQ